ncbi:MAG TPA: hypothetical protein VGE07_07370 [Herpetosiphonaceae bacterium]
MSDVQRVVREERINTPVGQTVTTVEDSTIIVPTEAEQRLGNLRRLRQVVYFIASALSILILLRFALMALGANMASGFGALVAALSAPFVLPFQSLFGVPASGGSVFEVGDLVAVAVYFLIAWGVVKIAGLVYAPRTVTGETI